jgi:hypothetical protein
VVLPQFLEGSGGMVSLSSTSFQFICHTSSTIENHLTSATGIIIQCNKNRYRRRGDPENSRRNSKLFDYLTGKKKYTVVLR